MGAQSGSDVPLANMLAGTGGEQHAVLVGTLDVESFLRHFSASFRVTFSFRFKLLTQRDAKVGKREAGPQVRPGKWPTNERRPKQG